jgi:hypothetical protein
MDGDLLFLLLFLNAGSMNRMSQLLFVGLEAWSQAAALTQNDIDL